MTRRMIALLTLAAGLGAVACSERERRLPAEPSFHSMTTSGGCDFNAIRPLLTTVFALPADRRAVAGLLVQMQQAGQFTLTARERAFDILAVLEDAVAAGNVGNGSDFINGLIRCMYDPYVPAELAHRPVQFPEDFTVELDFDQHGAFGVRGGSSDPTGDPVLSRPVATAFSGVQAGGTTPNWVTTVITNASPERVLVYGRPVPGDSNGNHYEWKTLPHDATFNPPIVVGLCLEDTDFPTSMVEMENTGVLPFNAVAFLPVGCSNVAMLESGWGQSLASRLARFGSELFGPRPLWATTTVSPGGLGGSTGGIRSDFGPLDLEAAGGVTLTVTQPPPANVKVNQQFTVRIRATTGTSTVGGVSIKLEQFNNNGSKVVLSGTNPVVTGEDGVATFTLSLNKPGAYRLRTTSATTVLGRSAISVAGTETQKFNVKPK